MASPTHQFQLFMSSILSPTFSTTPHSITHTNTATHNATLPRIYTKGAMMDLQTILQNYSFHLRHKKTTIAICHRCLACRLALQKINTWVEVDWMNQKFFVSSVGVSFSKFHPSPKISQSLSVFLRNTRQKHQKARLS